MFVSLELEMLLFFFEKLVIFVFLVIFNVFVKFLIWIFFVLVRFFLICFLVNFSLFKWRLKFSLNFWFVWLRIYWFIKLIYFVRIDCVFFGVFVEKMIFKLILFNLVKFFFLGLILWIIRYLEIVFLIYFFFCFFVIFLV